MISVSGNAPPPACLALVAGLPLPIHEVAGLPYPIVQYTWCLRALDFLRVCSLLGFITSSIASSPGGCVRVALHAWATRSWTSPLSN